MTQPTVSKHWRRVVSGATNCTRLTDTRASFWYKTTYTSVLSVCVTGFSLARHLHTWLTIFIWSRKVLDVSSTCPPTDYVPFHAHATHSVTEALLPLGHACGTVIWHNYATRTYLNYSFRHQLKSYSRFVRQMLQHHTAAAAVMCPFSCWHTHTNNWMITIQSVLYQTSTLWRPLLQYGYSCEASCARRVKSSFVIFDIRALYAQGWASECPDVKNYKWWLNPVWHTMLYSCCTHMATVGVKGLMAGYRENSGCSFGAKIRSTSRVLTNCCSFMQLYNSLRYRRTRSARNKISRPTVNDDTR